LSDVFILAFIISFIYKYFQFLSLFVSNSFFQLSCCGFGDVSKKKKIKLPVHDVRLVSKNKKTNQKIYRIK